MKNFAEIFNNVVGCIYVICSFLIFLFSIKNCFWKEKKSKIILVIISLLASPIILVGFPLLMGATVYVKCLYGLYAAITRTVPPTLFENLGAGFVFAICFLLEILLLSWICGNWLKVEKLYPMLLLQVMYGAISVIGITRSSGEGKFFSNPYMREFIDATGILFVILALICFYFWDVKAFARLIKVDVKLEWKYFIIPPTVFILFYCVASWTAMNYVRDERLVLSVYAFSTMLVFLFIWAFHVIVKNIEMTNEAVLARNDAIQARDEVKTLSVEVMEALAHTIDAKDEYTKGHSVRVAKYSRMMAQRLGFSVEDCENAYYMALLHDIGKIGVPSEIINSPTRLTEEQYAVVKTHPGVGFDILAEIKSRPDLAIGARWHHERYDGKGYPDGKAGEEIPIFARIIAVADTYDAMTSNRSYRKYLAQDVVREELEKFSGTQFDPKVAKCMIEIMDEDVNYELHE